MYNELKTLMQDRGKKKKGQSKQGGRKIVETEASSSQTPEGQESSRSKGYIIEKGKRSEYEASSMTPENKPKNNRPSEESGDIKISEKSYISQPPIPANRSSQGKPTETSSRKYKTSTGEEVNETEGYIKSKNEKGEMVEEKYKASSMTPSKPKKIMLKKNK
jgi:hypothetical protein